MFSKDVWYMWRGIACGFLLMIALLSIGGCTQEVEESFTPLTRVPRAVSAALPDGVKMARDAMLTYVTSNYDMTFPIRDDAWTVEYDYQGDCIGAGAYRLTTAGCVVEISNPLMAPDSTIYHVVLDDAAADFHWEGDVDCLGHVLPERQPLTDTAVSAPEKINIVTLADLDSTVGIEVCRLDCASYTPRFTIGSPQLIESLVSALDNEIPLQPHARCPAVYQLRFILADGRHQDFGYTCQMSTPTYLRGSQDFWMGQDGIAPDAFNDLMLPLIAPELPDDTDWKPLSDLAG